MIPVSRLNGKSFFVNADMIKFVESTPDTVITLVSGEKLMVRESADEVVRLALEYQTRIRAGSSLPQGADSEGG